MGCIYFKEDKPQWWKTVFIVHWQCINTCGRGKNLSSLVILLYISWKLIFVNDYNFITFAYDSFSSYSPELFWYFITSFMKEEIGKPVTCSSSHSKTMTLSGTYLNKLFPKPIPNWLVDISSHINFSFLYLYRF